MNNRINSLTVFSLISAPGAFEIEKITLSFYPLVEIVRQRIWGFSATGNERAFRNGALIVVHEHMQIGSWPTIFVHGGQKRCVHERPLIEG